nr:hypothetical protein EUGRSUZ_J03146 [Ipomoea batatas]
MGPKNAFKSEVFNSLKAQLKAHPQTSLKEKEIFQSTLRISRHFPLALPEKLIAIKPLLCSCSNSNGNLPIFEETREIQQELSHYQADSWFLWWTVEFSSYLEVGTELNSDKGSLCKQQAMKFLKSLRPWAASPAGRTYKNGAHEGSQSPCLSAAVERKPSQVEFQDANPKAPYIAAVTIVLAVIQTGVDPLGAPVGNRADGGVAIHGGGEDSRNPKINYLHHTLRTDEQIRGLDITMNNLSAVEIIEAGENLADEIR